jgi:hypothetical protein
MMKQLLLAFVALFTGIYMSAQAPAVDYTVDEVGTDFITISFTPNADAAGYAFCLFEAGTAEQQFAMFGPWMGFQTMADMIRGWGITKNEPYQYTWTNQSPGKDYEIYVQCWDAAGTDADMIIIPVTTASMGGDGVAEMTIQIGEFGGNEDYGFYQWVVYTPNENVALHRDIIIVKEAYESPEWGMDNLLEYLKQDNPYDPYWDQYGVDEAQWTVEPNTWYIACSIAKNANGEWGPLAMVEFKTPGTTSIDEAVADKQVAGVRYYNLAGQEMQQASGLTIVVTTYTDGTTSTAKVMK